VPSASTKAPRPSVHERVNPSPSRNQTTRKQQVSDGRRRERELRARKNRVAELETRIAEREQAIRDLEASMAEPGFFEDRERSQSTVRQREALMWEVGELMSQWEELSGMLESEA